MKYYIYEHSYLDKSNRTISGKLENSIYNNALFLGFYW